MKALLILCFAMVATLATGEPTPVPEESVRNLVERIRAELPQGWSVSYDAQYAYLEVKRNKPAATNTGGINYGGNEKRENDVVFFSLRVLTKVEPAEYDRLAAENARIRKEADAIYQVLNGKRTDRKFDSFSPREEEDKKLVARYEGLKESLHPLPVGYFQDISLDWVANGPIFRSWATRPAEESVAQEFEKALGLVGKLVTPYESKTPKKSGD
jgi:hypothetical protein